MKSTLLILALLSICSCGKLATQKDLNKVKDRVETLELTVAELAAKINANVSSISALNASINAQGGNLNNLLEMIGTLQGQTTELLEKQIELELEDRVVGIFDPCPSVVTTDFTESFFEMKSGKFVAFFEDGGKRFLTVLKTGTSYRTTDSRACIFSL